jgi:hypothetical protein
MSAVVNQHDCLKHSDLQDSMTDGNVGPETAVLAGFSWFSLVPPGKFRDSRPALKLGHDRFLPQHFQFIIANHHFIRRYIVKVTEKASSNKYINK